MNLNDYLLETGRRQADLARAVKATSTDVSLWARGKRPVPAERCPDIERATGGAVRCEDLRPDVDWGVVRQPAPAAEKAA